jgi:hypothetical protein
MKKELQIVTFEQAKILHKLGFDWLKMDDNNYFDFSENKLYAFHVRTNQYRAVTIDFLNHNQNCQQYDYVGTPTYDAPTVALALKWLRETKGIYVVTQPLYGHDDKISISKYRWWLMPDLIKVTDADDDLEYNSFEEAELAGLGFVLNKIGLILS